MGEIPPDLLAAMPERSRPTVEAWWGGLPEVDRSWLAGLWDERLEIFFFTPQADAEGRLDDWEQVPSARGGRYVPHDDDGKGEWSPGYFEHLLQHPVLAYDPPHRTFHIGCTLHPAARACLKAGVVPLEFECPVNADSCTLLALRGSRLTAKG